MLARARALPGGNAPNLAWIAGRVEDVALAGPFSSALAGESVHWFDWAVLARRLAAWVPSRRLILVERQEAPSPWSDRLSALIARFSTNRDFEPCDVVDELTSRRLLAVEGRLRSARQPFSAVDRRLRDVAALPQRLVARPDDGGRTPRRSTPPVRAALAPHAADCIVTLSIATRVVWGRVSDSLRFSRFRRREADSRTSGRGYFSNAAAAFSISAA